MEIEIYIPQYITKKITIEFPYYREHYIDNGENPVTTVYTKITEDGIYEIKYVQHSWSDNEENVVLNYHECNCKSLPASYFEPQEKSTKEEFEQAFEEALEFLTKFK